jgi:hypothetical protein
MSYTPQAGATGSVTIDCGIVSIQSFLNSIGLHHHNHVAALWLFFAFSDRDHC